MNADNNMHKNEERKDILRAPLIDGQRDIIYNEIDDKGVADDVINIIEYTITSSDDLNKFNIIVEALSPLIQETAKLIVSKLYLYKRRPCKFNNACKDQKCIFVHDRDRPLKNINNKRRSECEPSKRSRSDIESDPSKEVILNRVESSKYSEDDIKKYVSGFGEIENIKKLNNVKWLIVFREADSAKSFVNSRDLVLGDSGIKKYYNIMENMKKYELNSLFEKQEEILKELSRKNIPEVEELKRLHERVKTIVTESEGLIGNNEQRKANFNLSANSL